MTDEVERRLRSALTARAGQITPDRLRFGTPPTVAVAARSFPFRLASWLAVVSGAVIAVLLGLTLRPGGTGGEPAPQPPPAVPSPAVPSPVESGAVITTPSPGPSSSTAALPTNKPVTPDRSPEGTATPSRSPATPPGGAPVGPVATPTA
ncbi:MAG TPA: hypothetical protein VN408_28290 [Actinoplanes sp.]|nr:hypothetical protein [Actinoplanes sp.]